MRRAPSFGMQLQRFLGALWPGVAPPRVVRRAHVRCPRSGELVAIEMLTRPTGGVASVMRCSARRECPPACDQACRRTAEAVMAPVEALIILPPGNDVPDLID